MRGSLFSPFPISLFCLAFGQLVDYILANVVFQEVLVQELNPKWLSALTKLNSIYPEPADLAVRIGCSLNTVKRWLSSSNIPKRYHRDRLIEICDEEMRDAINYE